MGLNPVTMPYRHLLAVALSLFLSFPAAANPDTVTQFSTIDALLAGVYDGVATFRDVLKAGDFGLGTVDQLYGELIVLDGVAYQIRADGTVHQLSSDTLTPFAMVTPFQKDGERRFRNLNLAQLKSELDGQFQDQYLYAFRMEGKFKNLKLRSVPEQKKPFRPLGEVVKEQAVFEFEELEGTVVAFRAPSFLKGVSVPGYHLHFLSADRRHGGHVLDLSVEEVEFAWDRCDAFLVELPSLEQFHEVDLERDRENELNRVER